MKERLGDSLLRCMRISRPPLALVLVAVLGAAIVWEAPQAFVDAGRDVSANRDASEQERAAVPVRSQDLPTEVFTGAADAIPRRATYHVVVGPNVPLSENQRIALVPLLRYWLLPRRYTDDVEAADWVIAYGEPTETVGVPLAPGVEVSPGIVVAEVDR